jgi:hypothetical protein
MARKIAISIKTGTITITMVITTGINIIIFKITINSIIYITTSVFLFIILKERYIIKKS